jgi:hypothetical protein
MAALITLFILDALCIGTAIYCGWQATKYDWLEDKHNFFNRIMIVSGIIGIIIFFVICVLLTKMAGLY